MGATSVIRWLGWLQAGLLVAASILYAGLAFDLFGQPPDDAGDFVENLLASNAFDRSVWPADMASSLLFVGALAAVVLFAGPLARLAATDDARRHVFAAALVGGGIIGAIAQLAYVGAKQLTIDIPYCDCGFKTQEVISQAWAMWLVGGAVGWLVNGSAILLAIGVAVAGVTLGGRGLPAGWGLLSAVLAIVLVVTTAFAVLRLDETAGGLLLLLATGILWPIWAVWAALSARPTTPSG